LLTAFTTTELGTTVCREGAAVPVIGLAHGDYLITVRNESQSLLTNMVKKSSGWVLKVGQGGVLLCGLGYLRVWQRADPHHRTIAVPPGLYSVDVLAGTTRTGEWAIDFVVVAHTTQPVFSAALDVPIDFYPDET
jgi:hypothetical protein